MSIVEKKIEQLLMNAVCQVQGCETVDWARLESFHVIDMLLSRVEEDDDEEEEEEAIDNGPRADLRVDVQVVDAHDGLIAEGCQNGKREEFQDFGLGKLGLFRGDITKTHLRHFSIQLLL